MWEGDGKTLKIFVNGEEFSYCWYAFIDQNTTLLVGSSITDAESSESFIQILKDGKDKVGFMAMGVLVDNRLTQDEKTRVKEFCKEHGIVLVNTFSGNSKSNGIIEGNFSIFERQVGAVQINGETPEELAKSLAKNIIEIFTHQRNHGPRKRLGGKTPAEVSEGAVRPEHQRSKLEKLRDRLLKKELSIESKMQLLGDLVKAFEPMHEESLLKFREILKRYSADEIVAAIDRFRSAQAKHPENFYRSEYFLAILRNKRDENSKAAYNESFRATHVPLNEMRKTELLSQTPAQLAMKITAFLAAAANQPGTSHLLMSVDSLCWALMEFSAIDSLPLLWEQVVRTTQRCRDISLRKWQIIAEFIHERVGMFLFPHNGPPLFENVAGENHLQN